MKHILPLLFILLIFSFAVSADSDGADVARIHVIANSDSERDIEIKTETAKRVVELLQGEKYSVMSDIKAGLAKSVPEIESVCAEVLEELDAGYGARAEVSVRHFKKKSLGNSAFPEGDYLCLTVILGEGEGHNWWSVIFPEISLEASLAMGEKGSEGKTVCVGGEGIVKIRCLIFDLCKYILTKR